jgi:hypothetical protein
MRLGRSEGEEDSFVLPGLRDKGKSCPCPACFIPRERVPGTHWIGGWVGSRASLDAVVKRKIPRLEPPVIHPVAQCCATDRGEFRAYHEIDWLRTDGRCSSPAAISGRGLELTYFQKS